MDISRLITGAFLFGMWSCEYLTILKGEAKQTCILQKSDIRFYIKRREFIHNSGRSHLVEKVHPNFMRHKNGVKKSTVTQWRTLKQLLPLQVWSDIILRMESYPGTLDDTQGNMV